MKISNVAALFISLTSLTAYADLKPIADETPAMDQAHIANRIFDVKSVRSKNLTYKLVTMDTALNGDMTTTAILFTGEEVGSEAGFDAAFLISPQMDNPDAEVNSANDIRLTPAGVELAYDDGHGTQHKRVIKYDEKTRVLKEGKSAASPDCDRETSTNEVYQCLMTESAQVDKTLNSAYANAMKSIGDKIAQAKLKAAQKAWLAYRNAQCKVVGDENRGGTAERNQIAECTLSMAKARISELFELNR